MFDKLVLIEMLIDLGASIGRAIAKLAAGEAVEDALREYREKGAAIESRASDIAAAAARSHLPEGE